MDSHLQRPYDIIEVENLNYVFTNKNGIIYHVYFIPLGHIYPQFDNTYSFSIEPEDSTPHPIDRRISATVVSILKKFFVPRRVNDEIITLVRAELYLRHVNGDTLLTFFSEGIE